MYALRFDSSAVHSYLLSLLGFLESYGRLLSIFEYG